MLICWSRRAHTHPCNGLIGTVCYPHDYAGPAWPWTNYLDKKICRGSCDQTLGCQDRLLRKAHLRNPFLQPPQTPGIHWLHHFFFENFDLGHIITGCPCLEWVFISAGEIHVLPKSHESIRKIWWTRPPWPAQPLVQHRMRGNLRKFETKSVFLYLLGLDNSTVPAVQFWVSIVKVNQRRRNL